MWTTHLLAFLLGVCVGVLWLALGTLRALRRTLGEERARALMAAVTRRETI